MRLLPGILTFGMTLWLAPGLAIVAAQEQGRDPAREDGGRTLEAPGEPPAEEGSPAAIDESRDSELIRAIRDRDDDRIAALLAAGADVNARGEHGRTPLMYAASSGRMELLKTLLAAGAQVDARDDSGNTVLFFMPPQDDAAPVKLLLEHGARAAVRNNVHHTPLRGAALLGHTKVLGLLLRSGAAIDPEACSEAFVQAVKHHHFGAAKRLLRAGADVAYPLERGKDLLFSLAEMGDAAGVRFLIANGADVDSRMGACCHGMTPLMAAAKGGKAAVAAELLTRDARIEASNEAGYTPLLLAAQNGHAPMVALLLDHGADANARNRSGSTALMFACLRGDTEVARLLLARGADVDAANRDHHTALLFGVFGGHAETVELLLKRPCGVNLKTRLAGFGEVTPLILAASRNDRAVTEALLAHGAAADTTANVQNFGPVTPLMLAAWHGHVEIVKALLSAGADPSITQPDGDSALVWAREQGHSEVVALLEAAGAP